MKPKNFPGRKLRRQMRVKGLNDLSLVDEAGKKKTKKKGSREDRIRKSK